MKKYFGLFLAAVLPLFAVKEGDTLEAVIAEKGVPLSKIEVGAKLVLSYDDEKIKLSNGKVVEVKSAEETASPAGGSSQSAVWPGEWTTNYDVAVARAKATNKRVLLFFTGSDWCPWCKRIEAEIFSTDEFAKYARQNLFLVKLDFPRKSPQGPQLKAQNARLQQQYQIGGYPAVVVLSSAGEQIAALGYEKGGAKPFVKKLKKL